MKKKEIGLHTDKKKKDIVLYQTKSGKIEFRGDVKHETIWASQKQIAEVFDVDRTVVTKHISNVFKDQEVDEKSNVQKMHISGSDKPVKFYSLDIILAVGYRTNSAKAIQFRIWATKVLKAHLTDGYTINKQRISDNYESFLRAINDIQSLLSKGKKIDLSDVWRMWGVCRVN